MDLLSLGVTQLADKVKSGDVKAADVARACLARIASVDPKVHAFLTLAEESLTQAAKAIDDKRARGERCVLVVHGKGEHSAGGVGVLRGEIAAWLSQGRASEHVAAFATAQDADGGEGAMYVLLKGQ